VKNAWVGWARGRVASHIRQRIPWIDFGPGNTPAPEGLRICARLVQDKWKVRQRHAAKVSSFLRSGTEEWPTV